MEQTIIFNIVVENTQNEKDVVKRIGKTYIQTLIDNFIKFIDRKNLTLSIANIILISKCVIGSTSLNKF